jgi:hypothetical protein
MLRSSAAALSAFLIFAMPAAADPVTDARAETEAHLARADDGTPLCFPSITGPVEVHAVRASGRGEPATDHKTSPFRYADVQIEATAQPALIFLVSNGPTIWRVDAPPESRIAAVVIAGNREALVTGLPDGIQVTRGVFLTRLGEKVDCGKPRSRDLQKAVDAELQEIRFRSADLRDRIQLSRSEQLGMERAIRSVESVMPQAPALDVLRAELARIQDEQHRLRIDIVKLSTEERELKEKRPPVPLFDEEKDAVSLFDSNPPGLERGLAYFGDFAISSFQRQTDTKVVVISDAATSAFTELKRSGERDLATIVEPPFAVLPPDAPLLEPPIDLMGEDAIDYLLEQGYITADRAKAAQFICQRFDAAYRALGVNLSRCGYGRPGRKEYVVLGPLALKQQHCHFIEILYLPTGIPEPIGKRCADRVVPLNAKVCTIEKTQCMRRGGINIR